MNGISISLVQLLFKGVPEGFLMTLSFHLFTNTKIEWKRFSFLLSANILLPYLIRFLPISLGVNTILSLLLLIVLFQIVYRGQLTTVVRSIVTAVLVMTMIIIAETLNYFMLISLMGADKAEQVLNHSNEIIKSLYTVPSTLFLAVFILLSYWAMKKFENRKVAHGKVQ